MDDRGIGHFKGHPEKGAEMAADILRRLHLDNDTISKVKILIHYHDRRPLPEPKQVRRLVSKTGAELFVPLMQLKRADTLGQNPVTIEEKLRVIDEIEEVFRNVTADGTEYNIRTLAINGSDLKALGISEGRQIGRILKQMLELVIEGSVENERESLLSAVREYLKGEGIAD